MGTRGLTAVFVNGEYKIAQYGQWDHYPSGQGVTVLMFCKEHLINFVGMESFKEALSRCVFVDSDHIKSLYGDLGIELRNGLISLDESKRFKDKYPQFDRDMAAEVLEFVLKSSGKVHLKDSLSFAGNSLFCEWAYVIDLDKLTLEVYEGPNETNPLTQDDRFYGLKKEKSEYHPVKLRETFSLTDLPSEDEFLNKLEDQEDE